MRIVGGEWRGRVLEAPKGNDTTRPTTDRTREAIASMVLNERGLSLEGCSVLDAFAGSGAMGLELLSRGAERVTFVDSSKAATRTVQRNVRMLKAEAKTTVIAGDSMRMAASPSLKGSPFDIVFLDPPYALDASLVSSLVTSLAKAGHLLAGASVVYEYALGGAGLQVLGLALVRSKKMGSTSVGLYRFGEADD